MLLRPPPYARPDEWVLVAPAKSDGSSYGASWSGAQFAEWEAQTNSFAALAAYIG